MRQDWIEFEGKAIGKILVRPELISWISDDATDEKNFYVAIHIDDGSRDGCEFGVNESYDQVKQKIMDAEKVDYDDVVVEHFTKAEYQRLLGLAKAEQDGCREDNLQGQIEFMQNIIDKLNKILKEEE